MTTEDTHSLNLAVCNGIFTRISLNNCVSLVAHPQRYRDRRKRKKLKIFLEENNENNKETIQKENDARGSPTTDVIESNEKKDCANDRAHACVNDCAKFVCK